MLRWSPHIACCRRRTGCPSRRLGSRPWPSPGLRSHPPPTAQETRHQMTFPVQIGPSTITINRDDRVLVCQPDGRVVGDADGFFTRDTRFISGYDLWINGQRPILLGSTPIQFFSSRFESTHDDLVEDRKSTRLNS